MAEFAAGVYEPLLTVQVDADVAAAQRSTNVSVEGLHFSIAMIPAYPPVGWVVGRFGGQRRGRERAAPC